MFVQIPVQIEQGRDGLTFEFGRDVSLSSLVISRPDHHVLWEIRSAGSPLDDAWLDEGDHVGPVSGDFARKFVGSLLWGTDPAFQEKLKENHFYGPAVLRIKYGVPPSGYESRKGPESLSDGQHLFQAAGPNVVSVAWFHCGGSDEHSPG